MEIPLLESQHLHIIIKPIFFCLKKKNVIPHFLVSSTMNLRITREKPSGELYIDGIVQRLQYLHCECNGDTAVLH